MDEHAQLIDAMGMIDNKIALNHMFVNKDNTMAVFQWHTSMESGKYLMFKKYGEWLAQKVIHIII